MRYLFVLPLALLAVATLQPYEVAAQYPDHVYGVDVSEPVSTSQFSCLNAANLTFAIVRAWHSTGTPDTSCPGTVAAAWAGGLAHVDVYMFPCYSCGDPSGQVQQAISYLQQNSVDYGMFWLDIEGAGEYWSNNEVANQNFFEALRDEVVASGATLGIYSSASQWGPIFGSGYTGGSGYPLWYAHYDGIPSFSDFESFGGWDAPNMKQFSDAGAKCGASYDINWYPE